MDNWDTSATAQQSAYLFLREKILTGEYQGGMHLDPKRIAKMLDMSRMPIRESFRQLAAEGLILMRPNRGAMVTSLAPHDVEEIFEIRVALEVLAVRFAVANMTVMEADELRILKERMDRARYDPAIWLNRHNEFHQFISSIGKRRFLTQQITRLQTLVQPYLLIYVGIHGEVNMEGYDHDGLLDAILTRNSRSAQSRMRRHIRRAAAGIVPFLKNREAGESLPSASGESSERSKTR